MVCLNKPHVEEGSSVTTHDNTTAEGSLSTVIDDLTCGVEDKDGDEDGNNFWWVACFFISNSILIFNFSYSTI